MLASLGPFEIVYVSAGLDRAIKDAVYSPLIFTIEFKRKRLCQCIEVRGVPRAYDDASDERLIENIAHCDVRNTHVVFAGNHRKDSEQFLKQLPSSKLINDQLVFRQGTIFQWLLRLLFATPLFRTMVQQGVLHLV